MAFSANRHFSPAFRRHRSAKAAARILRLPAALCMLAALAAPAFAGQATAPKPAETAEVRYLREAEQKLDSLFVFPADRQNHTADLALALERALFDARPMRDKLQSLVDKGPKEYQPHAAAVLAKLHRLALDDPHAAIEIAGAFLVSKEKLKTWKSALAENRARALAQWEADCKTARAQKKELPARPDREVFAHFPDIAEWTLSPETLRCAIEVGHAYSALGRQEQAVSVFQTIAEKLKDEFSSMLAEEGGADAMSALLRYEQAIRLYEHSLQVADKLINYLKTDPFGEIKHIKRRIEIKLADVRQRWDTDRYGEGFVLYREAEKLRQQAQQYLPAYMAYLALEEKFPRTVYSEASQAYRVKCLLALTEPANARKAEEAVEAAEKELKKLRASFSLAKALLARKDKEELKRIEADISAAETRLTRMKAVPLGEKALAEAEKQAREFLAASEFGLYRGEVMHDLAAHHLHERLDPKSAALWLERCAAWLEQVEKVELALADYAVPDKARTVSTPPVAEKKFDEWGNVQAIEPALGAIINRLTCGWYLSRLRRELRLARGFLRFVEGAFGEAKQDFAAILELDPTVAELQRRGWPNAYRRLMEDCGRGYFWGWPEDLKTFKGAKRTAVFLAGFLFEKNEHIRSCGLYDRLLRGEMGELSKDERAFVLQGKGECLYMEGNLQAAKSCFEEVARSAGTPTEPKGLLSLANVCLQLADQRHMAMAHFVELHKRFPKSQWGEKGLYYFAFLQSEGGSAEGCKALEDFLRQYPQSAYAPLAERMLGKFRKRAD